MRFVLSFSCGKDSIHALHRLVEQGHEPVALITACSRESGRSFFHGADGKMLDAYVDALGLPLIRTFADGEDYSERFEEGLRKAGELGAEAVCFGDVSLTSSKKWNAGRARAAGLEPLFPLWGEEERQTVEEVISLGYRCLIKMVDTDAVPAELLGRYLDAASLDLMETEETDVCGENGEYHTLVVDGPCFRHPLPLRTGEKVTSGHYRYLETFAD